MSYLSVTQASPSLPAVDFYYQGAKINTGGQIAPYTSTGTPGAPYEHLVAGLHNFSCSGNGTQDYLNGNLDLLSGRYYSMFLYDTLQSGTPSVVILTDNFPALADTVSNLRFLDFAPDTAGYFATLYGIDSIPPFTFNFIGSNANPQYLSVFNQAHAGTYNMSVYLASDSLTLVAQDSLSFTAGKSYTVYLTGLRNGTAAQKPGIYLLQHN